MLKTKVIERHKPSNKVLALFNSTKLNSTFTNDYIRVIERLNKLNLEQDYEIFSYNKLTKNYS